MKVLSVVVPCFNEEENIELFYTEVVKYASFFTENDIELEFLFIDDGSTDNTVNNIKKIKES